MGAMDSIRTWMQNPQNRQGLLNFASGFASTPQLQQAALAQADSIGRMMEQQRLDEQAKLDREQRNKELEAQLQQQGSSDYLRAQDAERDRKSRERQAALDRDVQREANAGLAAFREGSLDVDRQNAGAMAAYRQAQVQKWQEREKAAQAMEAQGNYMGAMMLRAGGKIDPLAMMMMGGGLGMGAGAGDGTGTPTGPTIDDIRRAGANPPRG